MESSRFLRGYHSNQAQSSYADHESSQLAFHPLVTRRVARFRKVCERHPAGGRMSDERNEAGFFLCRSQRHEESKPRRENDQQESTS